MPANTGCPSQDLNFLSPNGFRFSIERLPKVSFFTQTIALPDVSLGDNGVATPLSRIAIPGDDLTFSPLVVPFIVTADMSNWLEIWRWIQGLGFPESYDQYTTEQNTRGPSGSSDLAKNYSDAFLTVLGSNNVAVKTFRFVDCFPTSLSGISFASTNTDVQYATAQIVLNYSYFKIDS
jgi:hypothetical protein